MRRPAGWAVLGQVGLEIAALSALLRILTSNRRAKEMPAANAQNVPAFIAEVSDNTARRYRLRTSHGVVYAGFYSDGRVRLATSSGARFSGVVVDNKAVLAALRDDVSFEMQMTGEDPDLSVTISGGPYDGQTVHCEPLA